MRASNQEIVKQGYLFKQGGFLKTWKKRYFALHSDTLYYFEDKPTATSSNFDGSKAKGIIPLINSKIQLFEDNVFDREFTFGVTPHGKSRCFVITTESPEALADWVSTILQFGSAYCPNSKTLSEKLVPIEKVSMYSLREGYMWKSGEKTLLPAYKRRYFILEQNQIIYYRGHAPEQIANPLRTVELVGASIELLSSKDCVNVHFYMPVGAVAVNCQNVIALHTSGKYVRTFTFVAYNDSLAREWIEDIRYMIDYANAEANGTPLPTRNVAKSTGDSVSTQKVSKSPQITNTNDYLSVGTENNQLNNTHSNTTSQTNSSSSSNKSKKKDMPADLVQSYFLNIVKICNNIKFPIETPSYKNLTLQLQNYAISAPHNTIGINTAISHNILNPSLLDVSPFTTNSGITSGWLLRQQESKEKDGGSENVEWRLRWVIVNRSTNALRYWESPVNMKNQYKPLKTVNLVDAIFSTPQITDDIVNIKNSTNVDTSSLCFSVHPTKVYGENKNKRGLKEIIFAAPSQAIRDKWVKVITNIIEDSGTVNTNPNTNSVDVYIPTSSSSSSSTAPPTHIPETSSQPELTTSSLTEEERAIEASKLVNDWKKACNNDIVSLLVSIHVILPQAPVNQELAALHTCNNKDSNNGIDGAIVKNVYHDVIKTVHPDKMVDALVGEKILAELVFNVLKNAYDKFKAQK